MFYFIKGIFVIERHYQLSNNLREIFEFFSKLKLKKKIKKNNKKKRKRKKEKKKLEKGWLNHHLCQNRKWPNYPKAIRRVMVATLCTIYELHNVVASFFFLVLKSLNTSLKTKTLLLMSLTNFELLQCFSQITKNCQYPPYEFICGRILTVASVIHNYPFLTHADSCLGYADEVISVYRGGLAIPKGYVGGSANLRLVGLEWLNRL
jgi:hypothetical protein